MSIVASWKRLTRVVRDASNTSSDSMQSGIRIGRVATGTGAGATTAAPEGAAEAAGEVAPLPGVWGCAGAVAVAGRAAAGPPPPPPHLTTTLKNSAAEGFVAVRSRVARVSLRCSGEIWGNSWSGMLLIVW